MARGSFGRWLELLKSSAPAAKPAPKARGVRLQFDNLEERRHPSTLYLETDLVSDRPGVARVTDPTLVNAWGIAVSPTTGGFWVSSNGKNISEVYAGDVGGSAITQPLTAAVPGGSPTGQVFNGTGSATDFLVTDGTNTKSATFLAASETGAITGWNPNVGVANGANPPSKTAEPAFQATNGAVYKGIALASTGGKNYLYATDFHNGKIDVVDAQFHKVTLGTGGFESFVDPNLPAGYAPFNVALIGDKLFVSYAKQDAAKHDDVAGAGNGLIDVFETNGHFDKRLVTGGDLNSPWAMVQAPATFGDFGNALLVGNFGSGQIVAYNATTGAKLGTLGSSPSNPLVINGLWGLSFGNGTTAGDANTLYFSAGPKNETFGLFGKITANAAGTNPVTAKLTGTDLAISGSPGEDHVRVTLDEAGTHILVRSNGQQIGSFAVGSVNTIHYNGYAGNDSLRVDPRVMATVIADGGAGSDTLIGGGGSDIFLGGAAGDLLIGGKARNILVGGNGVDVVIGNTADDIMIGGTTTNDAAALQQILTVWTSGQSYTNRVAAIRAGTGGVPKLDATTVLDDSVPDDLIGGPGQEWFWSKSPDILSDRGPTEQVN